MVAMRSVPGVELRGARNLAIDAAGIKQASLPYPVLGDRSDSACESVVMCCFPP